MNADHRRWAAHPDVLTTSLPDEAVLLAGSGTMYSLSGSAQVAWQALPGRVGDVVQALTTAFEVDSIQAERDVLRLLDELQALKLITCLNPTEPE